MIEASQQIRPASKAKNYSYGPLPNHDIILLAIGILQTFLPSPRIEEILGIYKCQNFNFIIITQYHIGLKVVIGTNVLFVPDKIQIIKGNSPTLYTSVNFQMGEGGRILHKFSLSSSQLQPCPRNLSLLDFRARLQKFRLRNIFIEELNTLTLGGRIVLGSRSTGRQQPSLAMKSRCMATVNSLKVR